MSKSAERELIYMIKAAVVGVGYLGKFHAEKYARSKLAELVAVVDTNEEQSAKIAKSLKVRSCDDYRILPSLGVQCASVASTTSTHFAIASWLLENGVDVMVEKPMTVTTSEARRLIEIAQDHGRILQVGHLERFNPAFCAVRKVLTRPMFFEARRIAQFAGRGHDVDVVRDLMIHDIDLVAHLVGRPVRKVEAIGVPVLTKTVDIANARVSFEGGAIANFTASRAAFKSERTVRIFQPDVYISLDFGAKQMKIYSRRAPGEKGSLFMPEIAIKEVKVEEHDALALEVESFLKAVSDRSKPEVTGEDGLRALELVDMIEEAFRESLAHIEDKEGLLSESSPGVLANAQTSLEGLEMGKPLQTI